MRSFRLLVWPVAFAVAACGTPAQAPPVVIVEAPPASAAAPALPVAKVASPRCGREPVALATHESLLGLAIDRDRVYWTDGVGTVMAVSKDGGEAVRLFKTELAPQNLTVVGPEVYWIEYGAVRSIPGEGAAHARTVAVGHGPTMGIAAVGSDLVVVSLDSDAISLVPAKGGDKRVLFQGKTSIRVAADPAGLAFWRVVGRDELDLTYVTTDGAPARSLVPEHQRFPGPIAMDAGSVYFDGGAGIHRVPRGGGAPETVTGEVAREIVVDGATLWFTTERGEVKRVPARGGATELVASAEPHFAARLAVDERCIYFAARGKVMKVAKP